MTVSLPEERALSGKGPANALEPITLDVDDDELQRFREKAKLVVEQGQRFTSDELHTIVARALLGL